MPGVYVDRIWPHNPTAYAPVRHRRACRYRPFMPDLLTALRVTLDAETASAVSEAESAILELNRDAYPALAPLARLLLRTESIASSKVEGLQLGVREVAKAEAKRAVGARIGSEAHEILANVDAMVTAVDRAASAPTFRVNDIRAIHAQLMRGSSTARLAGRVREEQNWIGGNDYTPCGADFVPPPPEVLNGLLTDLCRSINRSDLPPVVQAALVHAQFETIHPFHDGNGRTGRAIVHVVLKKRGLARQYVPPISVVLGARKEAYIGGLTDFRRDGVAGWIRQFADSTTAAARLASDYLTAVFRLMESWRQLLRRGGAPRAGAAAWALIDVLPAHPVLTGPSAVDATGRARAAVYQAIQQLVEAGVLIPVSASRRGQLWEPKGLIGLLERLDAGRAPGQ